MTLLLLFLCSDFTPIDPTSLADPNEVIQQISALKAQNQEDTSEKHKHKRMENISELLLHMEIILSKKVNNQEETPEQSCHYMARGFIIYTQALFEIGQNKAAMDAFKLGRRFWKGTSYEPNQYANMASLLARDDVEKAISFTQQYLDETPTFDGTTDRGFYEIELMRRLAKWQLKAGRNHEGLSILEQTFDYTLDNPGVMLNPDEDSFFLNLYQRQKKPGVGSWSDDHSQRTRDQLWQFINGTRKVSSSEQGFIEAQKDLQRRLDSDAFANNWIETKTPPSRKDQ